MGTKPPQVTATRSHGTSRVAVELDGRPWRVLPLAVCARAGLAIGATLDRERARTLNRALRQERALGTAVRLLRFADQSEASLERRLAQRGIAGPDREAALAALVDRGVVDDRRFAVERAALLARRGQSDAAIASDLAGRGLPEALVSEVLGMLPSERSRVEQVVRERGVSLRTLRLLARRGFREDALEAIVAAVGE
ncbi:MAG: RecX family transcriptional regulator [Gaiellales bacterium]